MRPSEVIASETISHPSQGHESLTSPCHTVVSLVDEALSNRQSSGSAESEDCSTALDEARNHDIAAPAVSIGERSFGTRWTHASRTRLPSEDEDGWISDKFESLFLYQRVMDSPISNLCLSIVHPLTHRGKEAAGRGACER